MTTTKRAAIIRGFVAGALALLAAIAVSGCGEGDPGALGPAGIDSGLSPEGRRQEYVDGVSRALQQLGASQGPTFGKAVEAGNRRQLQAAALKWRQGLEQLKQLDPPKDAVDGHSALVGAVEQLAAWNDRIVAAAPNKAKTKALARTATGSSASKAFEAAVCQLVDAGYEVVDTGACTPLANQASPVG